MHQRIGVIFNYYSYAVTLTAPFVFRFVHFGRYSGPSEYLFLAKTILFLQGLGYWDDINLFLATQVSGYIGVQATTTISSKFWMCFFWFSIAYSYRKAMLLSDQFYSTRNGIVLCLLCMSVPAILMMSTTKLDFPLPTTFSIICDGIVSSLLTSDIIVAKMCDRQLHPLIPAIFMFSLLGNNYGLLAASFYYISVFSELCHCFNTSLFATLDDRTVVFIGNIYSCTLICVHRTHTFACMTDGVFDMCLSGDKRMLLEAAKYGDLLIVGVFSDEDAERVLHRRPVLTAAERCAEVETLPFVHKVIRGSPSNGISKEFLLEHNIDVCVVPWNKDISNKEFAAKIKSGEAVDLYKGP